MTGEQSMLNRSPIGMLVVVAALVLTATGVRSFDDAAYPNLKGQWHRAIVAGPRFDQSKPPGLGQGAPLTAEYQALFEANLKDIAAGGQGCLVPGMPMMMNAYEPMEIVLYPEATHILIDHVYDSHRRIFTDGRDFPADAEPAFEGYSIGRWIDSGGAGRFDTLEIETRGFKGPRALDPTGIPTHADNQSIVKERIFFDRADPKQLHDEITLIDHALTRPWTVLKTYRRDPSKRPHFTEQDCAGNNANLVLGQETYWLSANRVLMPTRKDQPPPRLSHFNEPQK
jgi:hypothetical protein